MRLLVRIPNHPLIGRWYRIWYGHIAHLQGQRGVSRQNHGDILSRPITKSVRHSRRTIQCHTLSPLIGRECRRMHGHRQRSFI
jgi:hypothetical protein